MRIGQYIKTYLGFLIPKIYGPWSIGIYKGSSPFNISNPINVPNPVLTAKDVTDVDAVFVADPFLITKGGTHFLFFEVFNRETGHGDIGLAKSDNLIEWEYQKIVLNEPFHLSYPFVFEWENIFYMIPETNEDFSIRLYRASGFPENWEYVGNLLSGYPYVDATVFRHAEKWWLFVSTVQNNHLNLYSSEELSHGWIPHPMNPIVMNDKHISRPAGRVFEYDEKLYRLAQDDEPRYGIQVFVFEITELSETSYKEKQLSKNPLVTKTNIGWNAAGMHHVDLHRFEDEWIGVVDGRRR